MEHAEIVAIVKQVLAQQAPDPCNCKTCEVPQMFAQSAARVNEEFSSAAAARLHRQNETAAGYTAIQQKLMMSLLDK